MVAGGSSGTGLPLLVRSNGRCVPSIASAVTTHRSLQQRHVPKVFQRVIVDRRSAEVEGRHSGQPFELFQSHAGDFHNLTDLGFLPRQKIS